MTTAARRPAEPLLPEGVGSADDTATLSLAADFTAEKTAWAFVDSTLIRLRRTALSPRVHTAAGELVANALEHGLADATADPRAEPFPHPLVITLLSEGPDLLCAVFDPGTGLPRKGQGHGLHLVAAASDAWGWTEPGPWGKAVWSALSPTGSAPSPALTRRLLLLAELFTGSPRPHLVTAERPPGVRGLL
ncbi:ATP-binding protein [Streptomyces sp. NPDC050418]|uniref:ATP-binding protein n=1 Tax=Streptomyces sp. NPDC050418 TaxID=3365612 RepID=UPI0037B99CD2